MERMGTMAFLIGLAIAFAGSLPFVASVLSGMSTDLSGALAWHAWALGGVVAIVGVILTAVGDRPLSKGRTSIG